MKGRISNKMGEIQINPDVIALYAGTIAVECFGIVGMAAVSMKDGLVKLLKRESLTHGINVEIKENKISIDFPIGSTPTAIPVELELASGVTMKSPSSTSNTFDLTEIIPIYLEYKGEDYRYLFVGYYLPESIGGGVKQN